MAKSKRIVRRPWGRRKKGGWIIQPQEFLSALKDGEIAEIGNLQVGAKQLSKLIALLEFPEQEFLITTNGRLEVQNIRRILVTRGGTRRTEFRKPRREHSFRVESGSWIPNTTRPQITVVIKPRKFA